jgi:hypothetical protein
VQNQNQYRFKNILVIVVGFSVISFLVNKRWPQVSQVLYYAALGIGVLSLLSGTIARWIEWGWLKLALGLGWVNSRILLSVIYFVFLLPIAWVSRLFTNDPLKLKARGANTLYTTRDHEYKKEDLENIW